MEGGGLMAFAAPIGALEKPEFDFGFSAIADALVSAPQKPTSIF